MRVPGTSRAIATAIITIFVVTQLTPCYAGQAQKAEKPAAVKQDSNKPNNDYTPASKAQFSSVQEVMARDNNADKDPYQAVCDQAIISISNTADAKQVDKIADQAIQDIDALRAKEAQAFESPWQQQMNNLLTTQRLQVEAIDAAIDKAQSKADKKDLQNQLKELKKKHDKELNYLQNQYKEAKKIFEAGQKTLKKQDDAKKKAIKDAAKDQKQAIKNGTAPSLQQSTVVTDDGKLYVNGQFVNYAQSPMMSTPAKHILEPSNLTKESKGVAQPSARETNEAKTESNSLQDASSVYTTAVETITNTWDKKQVDKIKNEAKDQLNKINKNDEKAMKARHEAEKTALQNSDVYKNASKKDQKAMKKTLEDQQKAEKGALKSQYETNKKSLEKIAKKQKDAINQLNNPGKPQNQGQKPENKPEIPGQAPESKPEDHGQKPDTTLSEYDQRGCEQLKESLVNICFYLWHTYTGMADGETHPELGDKGKVRTQYENFAMMLNGLKGDPDKYYKQILEGLNKGLLKIAQKLAGQAGAQLPENFEEMIKKWYDNYVSQGWNQGHITGCIYQALTGEDKKKQKALKDAIAGYLEVLRDEASNKPAETPVSGGKPVSVPAPAPFPGNRPPSSIDASQVSEEHVKPDGSSYVNVEGYGECYVAELNPSGKPATILVVVNGYPSGVRVTINYPTSSAQAAPAQQPQTTAQVNYNGPLGVTAPGTNPLNNNPNKPPTTTGAVVNTGATGTNNTLITTPVYMPVYYPDDNRPDDNQYEPLPPPAGVSGSGASTGQNNSPTGIMNNPQTTVNNNAQAPGGVNVNINELVPQNAVGAGANGGGGGGNPPTPDPEPKPDPTIYWLTPDPANPQASGIYPTNTVYVGPGQSPDDYILTDALDGVLDRPGAAGNSGMVVTNGILPRPGDTSSDYGFPAQNGVVVDPSNPHIQIIGGVMYYVP